MILVSACLAGINCRYDGKNSFNKAICRLVAEGVAIPACPEQLGGLPTPRAPAEIKAGCGAGVLDGKCRVINKEGLDVTGDFIRGAEETLKIAITAGAKKAVLKSGSPSCGCGRIYDGTFSGRMTDGNGVAAEMLMRNGIEVISEEFFKFSY